MDDTPVLFRAVAATLAANGYRPVPIKPGEKRPPLADWQHFEYAAGCETRFGNCGAGVLLGPDLAAVDIDVEDPDAAAQIEASVREILGIGDAAEIPRRIGNPPRVLLPFRASTPFKKLKSASFKLLSTGTVGHVEVLAEGQQFVAFHLHPTTGRPYDWNGGGDLLAVPRAELFELTEAQAVAIIAAAETILEDWGERVVEKRDDTAAGATLGDEVPEGARDDALYKYGCKLARTMSAAEIEAALLALNAARCKPPLSETDVRRIARQAAKHIPPKAPGPPPAEPAQAEQPLSFNIARLPADWVDVEQHPPPFIVERLLPESEAGSLVAPGSFGKSTLKLYESVHILLGRDLYGRRVLKPGPVLCVSKEDRAALIDYRLKQICRGLNLSDADMRRVQQLFFRLDLRGDAFMLQRVGVDRIPCRSGDLSELVTAFVGVGIVSAWFDTASRFATGEGNQEAAITIDACTVLADAWGCATEVLHHVSQGIARTGTVDMHAGRGGTAFVDNGRFARQLVRHTGDASPGAISYRPPAGVDAKAETLLRLHTVKLTGARFDIRAPVWIERRADWQFVYAEGDPGVAPSRDERQAEARSAQATADDTAVLEYVGRQLERKPPHRMTQNDLIEARTRIVAGMSERRLRDAVGRLRLDNLLTEAPIPGKARGARVFLAPTGWQESLA